MAASILLLVNICIFCRKQPYEALSAMVNLDLLQTLYTELTCMHDCYEFVMLLAGPWAT
jgi:hypothetical protein